MLYEEPDCLGSSLESVLESDNVTQQVLHLKCSNQTICCEVTLLNSGTHHAPNTAVELQDAEGLLLAVWN